MTERAQNAPHPYLIRVALMQSKALPPAALKALLRVLDYQTLGAGWCLRSSKAIAHESGNTLRNTKRVLKLAAELGWLQEIQGGGRSKPTRRRVVIPKGAEADLYVAVKGGDHATVSDESGGVNSGGAATFLGGNSGDHATLYENPPSTKGGDHATVSDEKGWRDGSERVAAGVVKGGGTATQREERDVGEMFPPPPHGVSEGSSPLGGSPGWDDADGEPCEVIELDLDLGAKLRHQAERVRDPEDVQQAARTLKGLLDVAWLETKGMSVVADHRPLVEAAEFIWGLVGAEPQRFKRASVMLVERWAGSDFVTETLIRYPIRVFKSQLQGLVSEVRATHNPRARAEAAYEAEWDRMEEQIILLESTGRIAEARKIRDDRELMRQRFYGSRGAS